MSEATNETILPIQETNDQIEEGEEEEEEIDQNFRSCPGDIEIPNRIFVKGFSKDTTEEELKCFFEIYGIVHDAKIVCDKSGFSKGYAFVTFDSQEIASKVKNMGKVLHKDRNVVIGPARIRKRRPVNNGFNFYGDEWQIPNVPCYISPDGLWYFQPSPPFMQTPIQYSAESYPCAVQYASPVPAHLQHQQPALQYAANVPQLQQQSVVYTSIPSSNTTSQESTYHVYTSMPTSVASQESYHVPDVNQIRNADPETSTQQSTVTRNEIPKTVMHTSSPLQCVPIQYDARYIEETNESLPSNIMYVDASKVVMVSCYGQ